MSLELRVEYADSTTDTIDAATAHTIRDLSEQDRAKATVYRSDWQAIEDAITARTAKLFVVVDGTDIFAGRLDQTDTREDTVTVAINSPEIDAAEAEPTGNNVIYQNTGDDAIATDQIQAVSTLSVGTVTQQASSISYSVSYGSRSKILYDLRRMTGSEFTYNDDWTVDYVDRLGSDKSGSITLGPANANVGDDFNKQLDIRQNVTHVRGLGAQQGPNQITATGVAPSYSSGRKIYKRYENKEIVDQSRLQEVVDQLVQEYDGEPRSLKVGCTVYDEPLALGDTVAVDYPEENIDRTLRVVRLRDNYNTRGDTLEVTLANRNLTREKPEAKRNNDLQRFNRGYQGFVDRDQTTSGWNPAGDGVPQTLEIPSWPDDIVTEDTVELTVQGRAWRSPVGAAGHTHDVTVTHPSHNHTVTHPSHSHGVDVTHPSHSHNVTHPTHDHDVSATSTDVPNTGLNQLYSAQGTVTGADSPVTLDSASIGSNETGWPYEIITSVYPASGESSTFESIQVSLQEQGGVGNIVEVTPGLTVNSARGIEGVEQTAIVTQDLSGLTLELDVAWLPIGLDSEDWVYGWVIQSIPRHTHDISTTSATALGTTESSTTELGTTNTETSDTALGTNETSTTALGTNETATSSSETDLTPQVIDTFNSNQYWPTDVEIAVNGSTVTTLSGNSGADWQTTVDLAGQLTPGSNTITATPTSQRGSLNLILFSELFRRGPQSN